MFRMRKKPVIRTVSYVTKNGQLVRFDDLTLEEKRRAATELKLRYLRAMFPGVEFYVTKEREGDGLHAAGE